jgi:hypothetical protein
VLYNTSVETTSYGSNYLSLMSEQQQQAFNDNYTALIVQEAEKIYNKLITEFTNRVITAIATIR